MSDRIPLSVSSLKGHNQIFNLSGNTSVEEFKKVIYQEHQDISRPFSLQEIHKLDIKLTCQGKSLHDDLLLKDIECPTDDSLVVSIKSKPVNISPISELESKPPNLLDDYVISPAKSDHANHWSQCEDSLYIQIPKVKLVEINNSLTRISQELLNLVDSIKHLQKVSIHV